MSNGWIDHVPGPAPTPPEDVEVSPIVEVQLALMQPGHSYYDFSAALAWDVEGEGRIARFRWLTPLVR